MPQTEKPRIEELTEELDFWNTFREVNRSKGVDIARLYEDMAARIEQDLRSPGARDEFAELCKAGCLPQGLAFLVLLLKYSPHFENVWTEVVGNQKYRDNATHTLEIAAQTIEELFGPVMAPGMEPEIERFSRAGRLAPSHIVSELRLYTRVINLAGLLSKGTETHSLVELSKYVIAGYVRRMTGRFHDRCVSGLLEEIIGPPGYNEVAQRMWRARNYQRLEKHQSWLPKFLVAMSVVVVHTA